MIIGNHLLHFGCLRLRAFCCWWPQDSRLPLSCLLCALRLSPVPPCSPASHRCPHGRFHVSAGPSCQPCLSLHHKTSPLILVHTRRRPEVIPQLSREGMVVSGACSSARECYLSRGLPFGFFYPVLRFTRWEPQQHRAASQGPFTTGTEICRTSAPANRGRSLCELTKKEYTGNPDNLKCFRDSSDTVLTV